MHSWLGFFVTVHCHFFVNWAKIYLNSKGLKLDEWMESITAGRQGDIPGLYGLCLLTDSHCLVHLSRNCTWSLLDDVPGDHSVLMERCEIHLCYAGNGIFIQLIPDEIPLPEPRDVNVKMEVSGTLTADESLTLSILLKEGLGKAKTKSPPPHQETNVLKLATTASAGSAVDLPQLETELKHPTTRSISKLLQETKNVRVKSVPHSHE